MLRKQDLIDNFADVVEIELRLLKCHAATARLTHHYYVRLGEPASGSADLLLVSENREDDNFARMTLNSVPEEEPPSRLEIRNLPLNDYAFPNLLLAPKDYHAFFKGVLDRQRDRLVLCLPVHRCEFSGHESAPEFILMRKEVVPSLDWKRAVCPKAVLRFDNPRTRGGTGNTEVLAKYSLLSREIDNLNGEPRGFIDMKNYRGEVLEILSPKEGEFVLIRGRRDETRELLGHDGLLQKVWAFLNE